MNLVKKSKLVSFFLTLIFGSLGLIYTSFARAVLTFVTLTVIDFIAIMNGPHAFILCAIVCRIGVMIYGNVLVHDRNADFEQIMDRVSR